MAAPYKLKDDIRTANARILQACERLERHFPLSDVVKQGIQYRHREPLEQNRTIYQAIATYLEEVLAHLEAREETISELSELPEDFPGRRALLRNGYTSLQSVKALSEDDLVALDGIGEMTAQRILFALREG